MTSINQMQAEFAAVAALKAGDTVLLTCSSRKRLGVVTKTTEKQVIVAVRNSAELRFWKHTRHEVGGDYFLRIPTEEQISNTRYAENLDRLKYHSWMGVSREKAEEIVAILDRKEPQHE